MKSAMKKMSLASRFGLLRSDRGSVTIEFVIIVPLMLLILLGFSEVYLYMRAVSLVEHTAFTLADSLGQMTAVVDDPTTGSTDSLGSLWNAATLLAVPNALQTKGGVYITSICDQAMAGCNAAAPGTKPYVPSAPTMAAGTPVRFWQRSAPWTLAAMKSRETATSLLPATWPFRNGDSAVVVEVFYSYTPFSMTMPFWTSAPGTQTIYERVYVRPRAGTALTLVSS
ncbi:Flp pilus assembly protein TadG [Paraburkholderia sp. RAU2J]|uniref:TadE/TadG family type IV pilus assembly protein n=1 Tax=Paraburkholderia sp. RAU2J TaxID=1938810 RepID=UPI000EB1992C|nr:TadE/TadG family type IV pilus assembly protein [Paraburkholderia sp. RAU2J]RKT25695.1 Flp pilus assembly protein TadG [Paraburkholderia sp. RAU2J]